MSAVVPILEVDHKAVSYPLLQQSREGSRPEIQYPFFMSYKVLYQGIQEIIELTEHEWC